MLQSHSFLFSNPFTHTHTHTKYKNKNNVTALLSAQWPGLWVEVKLEVTLFWCGPHHFLLCLNQVVLILTTLHLHEKKQRGLYQSKVTSRLACIHKTGNWAHKCLILDYCRHFWNKEIKNFRIQGRLSRVTLKGTKRGTVTKLLSDD